MLFSKALDQTITVNGTTIALIPATNGYGVVWHYQAKLYQLPIIKSLNAAHQIYRDVVDDIRNSEAA